MCWTCFAWCFWKLDTTSCFLTELTLGKGSRVAVVNLQYWSIDCCCLYHHGLPQASNCDSQVRKVPLTIVGSSPGSPGWVRSHWRVRSRLRYSSLWKSVLSAVKAASPCFRGSLSSSWVSPVEWCFIPLQLTWADYCWSSLVTRSFGGLKCLY